MILPHWSIWAFLSAFIWATTNLVDKIVVDKLVPNGMVFLVSSGVISVIPAIVMYSIFGLDSLALTDILLSMGISVCSFLGLILYFAALKKVTDAAVTTTLWQMIPLFNLGFDYFLLQHSLSIQQVGGILLVTTSTIFIAQDYGQPLRKIKLGGVWLWMLGACLLMALCSLFADIATEYVKPTSVFIYGQLGFVTISVLTLLCFGRIRRDTVTSWKASGRIFLSVFLLIELIEAIAFWSVLKAFESGPLSLVSTVIATQCIFGLIITLAVSRISRGTLSDIFPLRYYLTRAPAILLVVFGIYLAMGN